MTARSSVLRQVAALLLDLAAALLITWLFTPKTDVQVAGYWRISAAALQRLAAFIGTLGLLAEQHYWKAVRP